MFSQGASGVAAVDAAGSDRFVHAARALTAASGAAEFGVRELIAAAGGSRKSFYARYDSKDDLLCEMFAQDIALGAKVMEGLIPDTADPGQVVDAWIRALFDLQAAGESGYVAALVREHRRLAERRPEAMDSALAPLLAPLVEAVGPDRARLVMHLTLAVVHDVVLGNADPATAVDQLCQFCRSGVSP